MSFLTDRYVARGDILETTRSVWGSSCKAWSCHWCAEKGKRMYPLRRRFDVCRASFTLATVGIHRQPRTRPTRLDVRPPLQLRAGLSCCTYAIDAASRPCAHRPPQIMNLQPIMALTQGSLFRDLNDFVREGIVNRIDEIVHRSKRTSLSRLSVVSRRLIRRNYQSGPSSRGTGRSLWTSPQRALRQATTQAALTTSTTRSPKRQ